jgi:glutamyl/glutaminyl-tRNA synthetase
MLLRIDDTDPARNVPGGEEAIVRDLEWLGLEWDEGPVRQSERIERYRGAVRTLPEVYEDEEGALRQGRTTLLRPDGTATYHLASAVDDLDFGITLIVRGSDHRANEWLHTKLIGELGGRPPEVRHHGLILGPDGRKLSKREPGSTIASLRGLGIPAEAARSYLDELNVPTHDVHYDLARLRRLSIDAIGQMSDEDLAQRVGVPSSLVPLLRGARDLVEARENADLVVNTPPPVEAGAPETLERFRELRERANGNLDADAARGLVRELKAVGGDLRALRLALTGRDRGPELWAIVAALPREEALRRIDAALSG